MRSQHRLSSLICYALFAIALVGCSAENTDLSTTVSSSIDFNSTTTPQITISEMDGNVTQLTENDINTVDKMIQEWVSSENVHDETSILNDEMTITACKVRRYGSEIAGVECDIYYQLQHENGDSYPGYEHAFIETKEDVWSFTQHSLFIGNYDGENGLMEGEGGEENNTSYYSMFVLHFKDEHR